MKSLSSRASNPGPACRAGRLGLSKLEAGLIVFVIGMVLIGAYGFFLSIQLDVHELQTQKDVLAIMQNLRTAYGGLHPPPDRISDANLISNGLVPSDMVAGVSLVNAFGGEVGIGIEKRPHMVPVAAIKLTDIPSSVCRNLLVKSTETGAVAARELGYLGINAGGKTIPAYNFPIHADVARKQCGKDSADIVYYFTIVNMPQK